MTIIKLAFILDSHFSPQVHII